MAASLGPSWTLRPGASPRCLTAYASGGGEGGSGPSDPSDGGGGGGGGAASNPFDDDPSSPHPSSAASGDRGDRGRRSCSVAFGTERGSLHYRRYPPPDRDDRSSGGVGGAGGRRGAGAYGRPSDRSGRSSSSLAVVEPEPGSSVDLQGAVKGSIVGIVRAYPPRPQYSSSHASSSNRNDEAGGGAEDPQPAFLLLVDDRRGAGPSSSAAGSSSNPGAYAAHLVVVGRGAFGKLPPAPSPDSEGGDATAADAASPGSPHPSSRAHRRGGSQGGSQGSHPGGVGGGGGGGGGWFGAGGGGGADGGRGPGASGGAAPSSASRPLPGAAPPSSSPPSPAQPAAPLGPIPRASCAAYHPDAGYVLAAGTGVRGLPAPAAAAVAHALLRTEGGSAATVAAAGGARARRGGRAPSAAGGGGGDVDERPRPPTAIYRGLSRALPLPGARPSPGGGGSLALACAGRCAVVAAGNAFYAVPCQLDVGGGVGGAGGAGGGGAAAAGAQRGGTGSGAGGGAGSGTAKILTFAQSSQVHPAIVVEVSSSPSYDVLCPGSNDVARYLRPVTSLLFLASGRECASVEISSVPDPRAAAAAGQGGSVVGGLVTTSVRGSTPRHGTATLPSPILAAAPLTASNGSVSDNFGREGGDLSTGPLVALLLADGLVHIRSPACVAVPFSSVEVGTRPNDFFVLSALPHPSPSDRRPISGGTRDIVAASYGGEARLISVRPESSQDAADRLVRLCVDAFGANGFPRLELAEATGATFSAASYMGAPVSEPSPGRRGLLRQYLESVLGQEGHGGGGIAAVSVTVSEEDGQESGLEVVDRVNPTLLSTSLDANTLLTCTALLCLVCHQLDPPGSAAACRASKACASGMGVVRPSDPSVSDAAAAVCELVAERLLKEADPSFSLLAGASASSPAPTGVMCHGMEFVESAVLLLRSCGRHERAIEALVERMASPAFRNAAPTGGGAGGGSWSQIKFDSYLATHLEMLWSDGDDRCRQLVLHSLASRDLIARNPSLGLSVFVSVHPQNEAEWRVVGPSDDPLAQPSYSSRVVELLKSVTPRPPPSPAAGAAESFMSVSPRSKGATGPLPMDSGRALAVLYLESAIGIATGRPSTGGDSESGSAIVGSSFSRDDTDGRRADMHDELAYLLLEGVISERGDADGGEDSGLGAVYRFKLRRLLGWPGSMVRSERLLGSLPSSFLRERALLLGRLGRHEDALRILYSRENGLELALEYCDVRHERRMAWADAAKARGGSYDGGNASSGVPPYECAYTPLVKVALGSDPDPDRGTNAAIRVLALRRDCIDKTAALSLLPKNVPMSALVRPFLIPAVIENESQVRRLTVAASLLRSRYVQLKRKLTEAQLASQSSLHSALASRGLNLGEPLHSSKTTRARPVHATSPNFPDVMLVKHFFPRHLVIQAHVTNGGRAVTVASTTDSRQFAANAPRTLADVAFVVAESSDEALVPAEELPLRTVPPGATGSAWCVLAASPTRLDGTAFLACEMRFVVMEVDAATGVPLDFLNRESAGADVAGAGFSRTYVEELQDVEVRRSEFG
ncbi:hypothetical protein ACHAWF_015197 [Thalassiosira exigua]